MESNELQRWIPDVTYSPGIIKFNDFERYKLMAANIADFVGEAEVTEENVKDSKRLVADTRKVVNGLKDKRIAIKKEILKPYLVFESQVKELENIVDDADRIVRNQIREIEEKQRDAKRTAVEELWRKRLLQYPSLAQIPDLMEKWFPGWVLNKTASMSSIEKDMTEFMEDRTKDIETIQTMEDSAELLTEYINVLYLPEAIRRVQSRKEAEKVVQQINAEEDREPEMTFTVIGEMSIELTKQFLIEECINYRREK